MDKLSTQSIVLHSHLKQLAEFVTAANETIASAATLSPRPDLEPNADLVRSIARQLMDACASVRTDLDKYATLLEQAEANAPAEGADGSPD